MVSTVVIITTIAHLLAFTYAEPTNYPWPPTSVQDLQVTTQYNTSAHRSKPIQSSTPNYKGQIDIIDLGTAFLGHQTVAVTFTLDLTPVHRILSYLINHFNRSSSLLTLFSGNAQLLQFRRENSNKDIYSVDTLNRSVHQALSHLYEATLTISQPRSRSSRWLDLISMGLGIFNTFTTINNRRAITRNSHMLSRLNLQISKINLREQKYIDTLERMGLASRTQSDQIEVLAAITRFHQQVNDLISQVDRTATALTMSSLHHQLSPALLDLPQLQTIFNHLHRITSDNHLAMAPIQPNNLIHLPLHLYRQNWTINGILHVPVVPHTSKMYRVTKPTPSLITTTSGHLLQFIADDVTLVHEADYITISKQDFADHCMEYSSTHLCLQTITRHRHHSCEQSLFSTKNILQTCKSKLRILDPSDEYSSQVGPTTFDWYVPSPTIATISCEDNTTQTTTLRNLNRITITQGCTMSTPNITVSPIHAAIQIQLGTFTPLPPESLSLLQTSLSLKPSAQWTDLSKTLKELRSQLGPPTVKDLEALPENNWPLPFDFSLSSSLHTLWLILISAFITIILTILCICLVRPSCLRLMRKPTVPPEYRFERPNQMDLFEPRTMPSAPFLPPTRPS